MHLLYIQNMACMHAQKQEQDIVHWLNLLVRGSNMFVMNIDITDPCYEYENTTTNSRGSVVCVFVCYVYDDSQ